MAEQGAGGDGHWGGDGATQSDPGDGAVESGRGRGGRGNGWGRGPGSQRPSESALPATAERPRGHNRWKQAWARGREVGGARGGRGRAWEVVEPLRASERPSGGTAQRGRGARGGGAGSEQRRPAGG